MTKLDAEVSEATGTGGAAPPARRRLLAPAVVGLLIIAAVAGAVWWEHHHRKAAPPEPGILSGVPAYRGIVVREGPSSASEAGALRDALSAMADVGANWVAVPVWVDGTHPDPLLGIVMEEARKREMRVCVVVNASVPPEVAHAEDDAPLRQAWLSTYAKSLHGVAVKSASAGVDLLCIGEDLQGVEEEADAWRGIVTDLRGVYHGALTYAAGERYAMVDWWDALDYIAVVGSTLPLTDKRDPRLADALGGWGIHLPALASLNGRYGKLVMLMDSGYVADEDVARRPGRAAVVGGPRPDLRATCYRAVLEATKEKDWLAGVFVKRWNSSGKGPEDPYALETLAMRDLLRERWRITPAIK